MDKNLTQALELIEHEPGAFLKKVFVGLSDLSHREMALFEAAWDQWSLARRQQLMAALYDYAQDHIETDYTAIFLWALGDADPVVRYAAIEGLWEDDDEPLMQRFIHLLRTDPDERVRAAAAEALGRFVLLGEYEEISNASAANAVETLLAALTAETEAASLTLAAIEAIGFASDQRVRALIRDAYDDEDELMQASALRAMGNSADSHWNPYVRRELESDSAANRAAAAFAAGELGLTTAIPRLLILLQDPDVATRRTAVHALGAIGGRTARKALQLVIRSDDEDLHPYAVEALEMLDFNRTDFAVHDDDESEDERDDEEDEFDRDFDDEFDRDFDDDLDADDVMESDFDEDDTN